MLAHDELKKNMIDDQEKFWFDTAWSLMNTELKRAEKRLTNNANRLAEILGDYPDDE